MNKATYVSKVKQLRAINDSLCKAGEILGVEFLEGPIGQLYDFVYDLMLPEGSPESVFDRFGSLLFMDGVEDEDIEEFYDSLFEE